MSDNQLTAVPFDVPRQTWFTTGMVADLIEGAFSQDTIAAWFDQGSVWGLDGGQVVRGRTCRRIHRSAVILLLARLQTFERRDLPARFADAAQPYFQAGDLATLDRIIEALQSLRDLAARGGQPPRNS